MKGNAKMAPRLNPHVYKKRSIQRFLSILLALLLVFTSLTLFSCIVRSGENPTGNPPTNTDPNKDPKADRIITDKAGRTVTIPGVEALKKIYFTGASAEIYCFTLAPDLAAGTTYEFTAQELAFLPKEVASLKYLGTTSGSKQLNLEAIMAEGVQLIISVPMDKPEARDITEADDIQGQTGIPVVVLDGSFENMPSTYRFLGELLGRQQQAEVLAQYCETKYREVSAVVASIAQKDRVSLYYAEGPDGLKTEPTTSPHALIFNLAGARNVVELEAGQRVGMTDISLEQVILLNPEVIITRSNAANGGAFELIQSDNKWKTIKAVQTGRVYCMPGAPFAWCDRPPSVNRILGLQWVANMLYPDAYKVDMVQVTREFYSLFYHFELSDVQAKELLGNSYPTYKK